jgi:hypothetical protein
MRQLHTVQVYVMSYDCQDEVQEKDALIRWLGENLRAGLPLLSRRYIDTVLYAYVSISTLLYRMQFHPPPQIPTILFPTSPILVVQKRGWFMH